MKRQIYPVIFCIDWFILIFHSFYQPNLFLVSTRSWKMRLSLRLSFGFWFYSFSIARATGFPQRVQIPFRISIPFSQPFRWRFRCRLYLSRFCTKRCSVASSENHRVWRPRSLAPEGLMKIPPGQLSAWICHRPFAFLFLCFRRCHQGTDRVKDNFELLIIFLFHFKQFASQFGVRCQ